MSNLVAIDKLLQESANQFTATLAQYQWELIPDSQLQAAKQALTKNDYITRIATKNPQSVHDSLIKAAILGVDLTEGKRQGWLIPRSEGKGDNKKQYIALQVGYKGVEAIHQRMKVIDRLVIRVVHQNDSFEWTGEDSVKPDHKADWFASDEKRGPIVGAYIITYFPDKTLQTIVTGIEEIYTKHRDVADSWKSYIEKKTKGEWAYPPPWVTYEKDMIMKTMAYIASKQWPAYSKDQERSSKIVETLAELDYSDYSVFRHKYTPEQKQYFMEFLEKNDSLGLYLFSKYVETETWFDLFNCFPRGEKSANKDKIRKMEGVGIELFNNSLEAIEKRDSGLLFDSVGESSDLTKKLLKRHLSDSDKVVFDEMLQEIV